MRAAAHVHSDWSYDGRWPLERIARDFARRHYDVVLMAEHDLGFDDERFRSYVEACAHASTSEVLLVPGVEYSDAANAVHVAVWGAREFLGEALETDDLLERATRAGGAAVLTHPGRKEVWRRFDPAWGDRLLGIELWNRKYDGWAPSVQARELLAAHPRLLPFVGLDFHTARQFFPLAMAIGTIPERTPEAVVAAMRSGRCEPRAMRVAARHAAEGPGFAAARAVERARRTAARAWRSPAGHRLRRRLRHGAQPVRTTEPDMSAPWNRLGFAPASHIPSMISTEEARYLFWLGRDAWSGHTDVVEFGPWLGGSTFCLAEGMKANPRRAEAARLHVVDNFVWREFMAPRAGMDLAPGESFRRTFETNLDRHRDLLAIHEVRLPDERRGDIEFERPMRDYDSGLPLLDGALLGQELGVVFVDGAKSWPALIHMLREVIPRCVPGETIVVWQDYKAAGAYWVPMGAALLENLEPGAFELLHALPVNSVSFRQTRAIDPEGLSTLPDSLDDVTCEEALALLAAAAGLLRSSGDADGGRIVDLAGVHLLGAKGEWTRAVTLFERLDHDWPSGHARGQLDRTREWLGRFTQAPPR